MTRHRLVVRAPPEHRPVQYEAARAEATRLRLPFADDSVEGDLALVLDERGWALVDPAPRGATVRCDLTGGELGRRLRSGRPGERRLATALGLRRHPGPRVVDATAGLGRESVLAAALGCTVVACERSPVVALLLRDGLERAAADPTLREIVERVEVYEGDTRDLLAALPGEQRPDVVLVDPMFPPPLKAQRSKAALAKKEMQLLQRLLGAPGPGEDEALLAAALHAARRRVVVKRPPHAPALSSTYDAAREPDIVLPGRASRYDVYLVETRGGE